jgi:hypothetical protein
VEVFGSVSVRYPLTVRVHVGEGVWRGCLGHARSRRVTREYRFRLFTLDVRKDPFAPAGNSPSTWNRPPTSLSDILYTHTINTKAAYHPFLLYTDAFLFTSLPILSFMGKRSGRFIPIPSIYICALACCARVLVLLYLLNVSSSYPCVLSIIIFHSVNNNLPLLPTRTPTFITFPTCTSLTVTMSRHLLSCHPPPLFGSRGQIQLRASGVGESAASGW